MYIIKFTKSWLEQQACWSRLKHSWEGVCERPSPLCYPMCEPLARECTKLFLASCNTLPLLEPPVIMTAFDKYCNCHSGVEIIIAYTPCMTAGNRSRIILRKCVKIIVDKTLCFLLQQGFSNFCSQRILKKKK